MSKLHHVHVYTTIRVKFAVIAEDHADAMRQAEAIVGTGVFPVHLFPGAAAVIEHSRPRRSPRIWSTKRTIPSARTAAPTARTSARRARGKACADRMEGRGMAGGAPFGGAVRSFPHAYRTAKRPL